MSENLILEIFDNFDYEFEGFKQGNYNTKIEQYFKQIGESKPKYLAIKGSTHQAIGFIKHKMLERKAVIRYKAGDYYIGDYRNNKRHGYGYRRFVNGIMYKGKYNNDIKVEGIVFDSKRKRIIYEGSWGADKYNGRGKLASPTGEVYTGNFRNGKFHGDGTLTWSNGSQYNGQFADGKRQGQGKLLFNYGDEYEGEFAHNLFHGYGKYTWSNGDIYEGEFIDGMVIGNGTMSYRSLKIMGSGIWDDISYPSAVMFNLTNETNHELF